MPTNKELEARLDEAEALITKLSDRISDHVANEAKAYTEVHEKLSEEGKHITELYQLVDRLTQAVSQNLSIIKEEMAQRGNIEESMQSLLASVNSLVYALHAQVQPTYAPPQPEPNYSLPENKSDVDPVVDGIGVGLTKIEQEARNDPEEMDARRKAIASATAVVPKPIVPESNREDLENTKKQTIEALFGNQ